MQLPPVHRRMEATLPSRESLRTGQSLRRLSPSDLWMAGVQSGDGPGCCFPGSPSLRAAGCLRVLGTTGLIPGQALCSDLELH